MKELVSQEDMSAAVAYIDGALSEGERVRFELRLAADAPLAAAVESLLEADELMRRLTARESAKVVAPRRLRLLAWSGSLAAAALVLIALGVQLFGRRDGAVEFTLALAPSWESGIAFAASQDALAGLRPPGLDELRAGDADLNIGAEEFGAKAREVEARVMALAQNPSPAPITAGYFVVPLQAREACSVVVLGLPRVGAALRLHPQPGDARPVAEQGRLSPGAHLLPSERIEIVAGAEPSVRYHSGFLVPVGCEELTVLCAARSKPLDEDTMRAIDAALAGGSANAALKSVLAERSFAIAERRVIEPKD